MKEPLQDLTLKEQEQHQAEKEQERLKDKYKDYAGNDRVISFKEAKEIEDSKPQPRILIHTGLPSLDAMIEGFTYGEVVIVSGFSKHGKTTLTQTFTRAMSEDGHKGLWLTYEVSYTNFLGKTGVLKEFYIPKTLKDNSLDWIGERMSEAKIKYDCNVVFIDHLHYLVPLNQNNNMSITIGYVMRQLHRLAVKLDYVVILIAHTGKTREAIPEISDIRDSSFVVQEADDIILINRIIENEGMDKVYTDKAFVQLVGNRRMGALGHFTVEMDSEGLFKELK